MGGGHKAGEKRGGRASHPGPFSCPTCALFPRGSADITSDATAVKDRDSADPRNDVPHGELDHDDKPNPDEAAPDARTLTIAERRDTENNTCSTYVKYIKAMGSGFFGFSLLFGAIAYSR